MARWRIGLFIGGALLALSGLLLPDVPGAARLALLVIAGLLALAGGTGQGFARAYSGLAVLAFNTILLVLFVEAGASLLVAARHEQPSLAERADLVEQDKLALQYYSNEGRDWAAGYWDEHLRAADRWTYYPYALWRGRPFDGEYINISEDGLRATPGSDCGPDSYRIYMFGGSTMWGFGVPDGNTVPAYVQADLADRDVCVTNYGQVGYSSTQELIQLILLLRQGDVPDAVIFYDGNNEVSAAHRTGVPGWHFFLESIAPAVHGQPLRPGPGDPQPATFGSALSELLGQTALYRLVRGDSVPVEPNWALPPYAEDFVQGIADVYLENYRILDLLATEYDFALFAFIQPILPLREGDVSTEEQMFLWDMPSGLTELYQRVYPHFLAAAQEDAHLYDLTHALDDQPYLLWIDYDHLTPWGNLIIADQMVQVILLDVDAALADR